MGFLDSFKKKPENNQNYINETTSSSDYRNPEDIDVSYRDVNIENSETDVSSTEQTSNNKESVKDENDVIVEEIQENSNDTASYTSASVENTEKSDNAMDSSSEFVQTSSVDNAKSEKNQDNEESNETMPFVKKDGKTKVISILNQKGGVGKSTTAINLSAALGVKGAKILLIDLDPQGNTSSGLGIEKNKITKCIYDVLLQGTDIHEVIIKDVVKGVDVVPATINLAGAEVELVSEIAREQRLKQAVDSINGQYDFIFVDCPPSLGLLTVNALVAADKLLIPIQCEFYALEGVTKLLDSMKRVKSLLNPDLDIFGVVLTMYDNRTTLSKQVAEEVCQFFGDKVFESKIPRTVKISEAPSFGIPINEYEPLCKGSIMYESLAEEVIDRG